MPLEQLLQQASASLSRITDSPRAEAEWLLAELLGSTRTQLLAGSVAAPDARQSAEFEQWLGRRMAGEPFAYITGEQPFHTLNIRVTPDVLIPRPETEHLVDWALQLLATRPASAGTASVLDVCTGSGCVALAIARGCLAALVVGSDISPMALVVACSNATRLQLQGVQFVLADGIPLNNTVYHLIVGNPPYIAEHDHHLTALAHEPRLALVSGSDGLDCLRQLIASAPAQLTSGGWLLLEHGHDQGARVRELFTQAGLLEVQTRRDYGGNERLTGGRR